MKDDEKRWKTMENDENEIKVEVRRCKTGWK
jgi:hypothetical protein